MGDESSSDDKRFDPMEPWRGMRDAYLDAWAKSMVNMVNSEAYAQANGAMLDTYLTVSTPFREAVEKAMLKTLEQLAMPSRADIVSLAERLTNIELRLDDMDAKLDRVTGMASRPGPATRPQPARMQQSSKKQTKAKAAKRGKK